MEINTTQHFDASPDAVKAMYLDPEFWRTIVERGHGKNPQVQIAGDTADVNFDMDFPDSVPAIVTKVVGKVGKIFQKYQWAPSASDTHTAVASVGLSGVPAKFDGNIQLAPEGSGTKATIVGEFAVRVPLIGKKIEAEAAPIISDAFELQAKVGSEYLAAKS